MIYSCFNARLRQYEVFEDGRGSAINADLPVPAIGLAVNGIGAPAMESGRKLPRDAKRIGLSWHPRGIIVQCNNIAVRGIGAVESPPPWRWAVGLTLAAATVYAALKFAESTYFTGASR